MVAAEAVAADAPVVASDVDRLRDVVARAGGVLVPPERPDALAAAVAAPLAEPARAATPSDRSQDASARWDRDVLAEQQEQVHLDVVHATTLAGVDPLSVRPPMVDHMFDTVGPSAPGTTTAGAYPAGMAVSAHDVAAVLRGRLPGLPVKKLHKLLYYCQGHHLAAFGEPLFVESVSAWDMGPVVGRLWYSENEAEAAPDQQALDEGQLNTIGYVLSRYGRLTGRDLEILSHGEEPWLSADQRRPPHGSVRIDPQVMRAFFASRTTGDDEGVVLDSAQVTAWLAGAQTRRAEPSRPDDLAELRSRLDDA